MAPELLNGSSSKVSEKVLYYSAMSYLVLLSSTRRIADIFVTLNFLQVDVFSFGIVMWEILTGDEPYANMHYGAIIGTYTTNAKNVLPCSLSVKWWFELLICNLLQVVLSTIP